MTTPLPLLEVKVGGRTLQLCWNRVARYRISTLGDVDTGAFAAMLNILWAADTTRTYPSPEAIAEVLTDEEEPAALAAVQDIITREDAKKKASSTNGPSPATTSDSPPTNG
jgi:hypothetical protein